MCSTSEWILWECCGWIENYHIELTVMVMVAWNEIKALNGDFLMIVHAVKFT